jgi:NTE family protein
MPDDREKTGFVLAGGAARGAYEVGVLDYVLHQVARDLGRPIRLDVLSGTSVGALNACGLAAFADEGPAAMARLVDVWTRLRVQDLVRPDARGVVQMGARLLGRPTAAGAVAPPREGGLIDPAGLERVVRASIPFGRIAENLAAGHVDALTVSTTHIASGRTVVHVQTRDGRGLPPSPDPTVVARATTITAEHALASAAIPILFRAVRLEGEWYCDGGLRQNVPLSPARRLGASRVLVVNPRHLVTEPLDDRGAEHLFPSPLFVLGKTLNALLLDRIDSDLARVESVNRILDAGARAYGPGFVDTLNAALGHEPGRGLRPLRALLVRSSEDIGRMAAEFARSPAFDGEGLAGRLVRRLADSDSRSEADLLSYVLFDGAFAGRLVDLGRADARARHAELSAFFADP